MLSITFFKPFLIFSFLVFVTGCSIGSEAYRDTIQKSGDLSIQTSGKYNFKLENINGEISIRKGTGSDVKVNYTIKTIDREGTLTGNPVSVELSESGSTIYLKTKIDKKMERRNISHNVTYNVYVPEGIAVSVENVNGNIVIEEIDNEINAELVNGNIDIKGSSGRIECGLVNGNIKLDVASTTGINAETVNGNITLNTDSGFGADLQAETVSGSINNRGTMVKSEGYVGSKSLNIKLGSGGSNVTLETVNGHIKIN